jgi:hypothetical protein
MALSESASTAGIGPRLLLERVCRIMLAPRTEWSFIDREPASIRGVYLRYVVPLAANPPLAGLVGMTVLGVRLPYGGTYRVSVISGLSSSIVQYVLGLLGVFALALVVDALAPTFGGTRSLTQALKLTAYAGTASWLIGLIAIAPALSWLGILGLYSLYLLYLGLPVLMRVPSERALGYTAAVIVSAIVLFVAIAGVAARFSAYPALSMPVR